MPDVLCYYYVIIMLLLCYYYVIIMFISFSQTYHTINYKKSIQINGSY